MPENCDEKALSYVTARYSVYNIYHIYNIYVLMIYINNTY